MVSGGEEVLGDADIKRATPGPDAALELPLGLEGRTVGRLDRRETGAHRINELHRAEVGREAKANLDRARIVDPEPARGVCQREALPGAGFETSRRLKRSVAHEVGPVLRRGHFGTGVKGSEARDLA
jgi:hypothetical protein